MKNSKIKPYNPEIGSPQKDTSFHFEAFFEYAILGIVVTDAFGKIMAVNPYALQEFGYKKEELIGKEIEILVPSRFRNNHRTYHKEFVIKSQTRIMGNNLELFALKKDGSEFGVEISLSNYELQGNKFVIAFINNISERKKAALEIERLNEKLETTVQQRTKDLEATMHQLEISGEKLEQAIAFQNAILDNVGAMIVATDMNGRITLFNREACHLTGYQESEIVHKHTPLLFHDTTEIARKRRDLFSKYGLDVKDDFGVILESASRNAPNEEQYTHIRKDGTTFPVSLNITAIHDQQGKSIGYIGVVFDISERKKAEEELLESLKRERELSELKSRFITMASHEFRTPLSTVLSSSYLIEKYELSEDQPKREKHLHRIISSVNMLTDILNDFLSVGKIEEGKIQVRLSQFNIREMVIAIAEEIKFTLLKQQNIYYHHEGDTTVLLDATLMKHIILNLISNASKFSPEGRPIEIKTTNHKGITTLSVKDHGMGISVADQQHLKERFFRGANAGNIQGTGLGLHIVAKYAELMNGTIECISELEIGTEFVVTFITKK